MRFETFDEILDPLPTLFGESPAHPEDAFLAAVTRVVRCSAAERQVLRALASEALDQADGLEGDFGRLDVDRWL